MRQIQSSRSQVASLCPDIVRAFETDPDPSSDVGYFLAVAILPGAEAIPMEVEADPAAIRAWMERSLLMQARGFAPGRRDRLRAIRGRVPVPANVAALIHTLALDESDLDPDRSTLNARLSNRLSRPDLDPRRPGSDPAEPAAFAPPAPRFG